MLIKRFNHTTPISVSIDSLILSKINVPCKKLGFIFSRTAFSSSKWIDAQLKYIHCIVLCVMYPSADLLIVESNRYICLILTLVIFKSYNFYVLTGFFFLSRFRLWLIKFLLMILFTFNEETMDKFFKQWNTLHSGSCGGRSLRTFYSTT